MTVTAGRSSFRLQMLPEVDFPDTHRRHLHASSSEIESHRNCSG